MTMSYEQPDIIQSMQQTLASVPVPPAPVGDAISSRPMIGPEIRLSLSPGMFALLVAPITVALTMVTAWVLLTTVGASVFAREMVAAGIVNTIGGVFASIPLFILMKKGTAAIAQAGILGIALRIGSILMGTMIAGAQAWQMHTMPLVYWVMAFYFPLLMVETGVIAWLSHKARH